MKIQIQCLVQWCCMGKEGQEVILGEQQVEDELEVWEPMDDELCIPQHLFPKSYGEDYVHNIWREGLHSIYMTLKVALTFGSSLVFFF
jgi:hypothetical protein